MKSWLTAATLALGLALPAMAQERPNTILVLDASGSMWGQIDGVNKITIARDVVRDFVGTFPADLNLGLVTYGHRERGQCSDIQTMIDPAPGTGAEIARIVDGLNPRGMTPMTDAVIAAAQALRHTEQAATVILISDGIETCNPDPCAAARALNEAGVDFTAHVIGFDVKGEAEALMQMQCIAEETGGRFLTADNAAELTAALEQVAAPTAGPFTFTAHQSPERMGSEPVFFWPNEPPSAPLVAGEVFWQISDNEFSFVSEATGNPLTLDLPFGDYVVTVTAHAWDQPVQTEGTFGPEGPRNLHVMFPPAAPALAELTLRAVMDSADGPLIDTPFTWEFSRDGDSFEFDGNPGVMEVRPGGWTITGHHTALERAQSVDLDLAAGEALTHVMVFETPAAPLPTVTVSAPAQVVVGAAVPVSWTIEGDVNPRDYVTIVPAGAEAGVYTNYDRLEGRSEGRLRAPAEPGLYEVRLQTEGRGSLVLATTAVEVIDAAVTVSAPAQVAVGSAFTVTWEADGLHPRDYVTIVPMGAEDGAYTDYDRMEGQTEGRLRAPAEPGLYEVRLQMEQIGRVLARTSIEVVDVEVSVSAPAQVAVGSAFTVTWEADGLHPRDYVTIVPMGAEDGAYTDYNRMEGQTEGRLRAPAEPGLYEVRLQMEQIGRVLARTPIEVVEGNVTVSGPDRLRASSDLTISWTGAIHPRDYVTIVPVGTAEGEYGDYRRIDSATQVKMTAPTEPGAYEIRYHLDIDNRVMARHPFEVLAADAALDDGAGLVAPATAKPGETITVTWTASQDGRDQRVALARADQADFSWISATSSVEGNSLDLTLPDSPGTYELRFLDLTDRKVLGRSIIEVQP
ncbi:VWA domain-containing protein [Paracoccus sp. IB05]|uniref:vWA domain-containing protein n=1 Tax=Paracoccus sp. IB05 TaxID=2779367 RepID=UPI0018E77FA0|nr:VWA domain-containing protein [Paracoccus sp. IB05]MBJ2153186.1 VWA domain-containing protein [Paracoccus sp. IB05]